MIDPGSLDSISYTLPRRLYRKTVQACYINIPGDIFQLQIEIRP